MDLAKSLTGYKEEDLVQHMVAEPDFWNPFLAFNGVPENAKCFCAVPLEPLLPAQGDVDALVVDPAQPERATAFQVKRIKVEDSAFDTECPNGIGKLAKLHQQSEVLIELGFWRVFSVVLVVVDGRLRTGSNSGYASLTPSLDQAIRAAVTTAGLNTELGLVRMDYVQSFPGPLLHSGTSGIALLRNALVREQHPRVTSWVRHVIGKSS